MSKENEKDKKLTPVREVPEASDAQWVDTQPLMTLADVRRLAGKSQKQVAEAMGVGRARVSQIEADYPNLHYTVVQGYFRALGARIQFAVPGGGVVRETAIAPDTARTATKDRRAEWPDAVRYG